MNGPDEHRPMGQAGEMKTLPARQGIAWLTGSVALIRAQAGRLLFLAVLLQLILGLSRIPLIGFFVVMAVPALSAGLLQAFRMVAQGQRPSSATLFAPLVAGPRTGRLLLLGAVTFLVGILSVSLLLSGSAEMLDVELLARIEQGDTQAMAELDPALMLRIIMALVVGVTISGTLSFMAIPLIWFGHLKLGAAILGGLRTLLVNWKPFTFLALGLAVLLVPVGLIVTVLFQVAGTAGIFSIVLLGLVMLIALAFQLAVFGTQFTAFRDIYGLDDGVPPPGPSQDDGDQLLA